MLSLEYHIRIGGYRLGVVDSVTVRKSVERLADSATIVLPATYMNKSVGVEDKLHEGDTVRIKMGYGASLQTEFNGYLNAISTDDNKLTLECEDSIYLFRQGLKNRELSDVTVAELLQAVVKEVDPMFTVQCDYHFIYSKFILNQSTAWDVLKKVQEDTKANIYFVDSTLHVHPQYLHIANRQAVRYDFAKNVEKSQLKYKKADKRKYWVEVESASPDGTRISITTGNQGGEKRSIKLYGVADEASLRQRANEEIKMLVYDGFEGNLTGWLVPYCEPGYKISLNDSEYPEKNGTYYVVSTEARMSSRGGERTITIGKKIG